MFPACRKNADHAARASTSLSTISEQMHGTLQKDDRVVLTEPESPSLEQEGYLQLVEAEPLIARRSLLGRLTQLYFGLCLSPGDPIEVGRIIAT